MDGYKQIDRNRLAPVLTRKNWEKWFELMELHFVAKSIVLVIQMTVRQYAWISDLSANTSTQSTPAESSKSIESDGIEKIT
jgi:hypothetical protein